ncbi:MAG: hypothetical protein L3J33_08060 [Rhodobacteraceae bacterium]|nr:hypothetical protein [Paracoccaceae bacterium]
MLLLIQHGAHPDISLGAGSCCIAASIAKSGTGRKASRNNYSKAKRKLKHSCVSNYYFLCCKNTRAAGWVFAERSEATPKRSAGAHHQRKKTAAGSIMICAKSRPSRAAMASLRSVLGPVIPSGSG